jgi:hypothetical protein
MTAKEYQTVEESRRCRAGVDDKFDEIKSLNNKMREEVTEIKETQIKQGEELKYMRVTMNSIEMKMDNFIKASDERYASKLAEKVLYGFITLVLIAVITNLITPIFK